MLVVLRQERCLRLNQPDRQSSSQGVAPAEEGASDQAMRLLKRMRPDELRKPSKAATALEKTKLEDGKKVAAFVAKNDNFVELVGDCYICLEPLLNNNGSTKFGVLNWRCRCRVPPKAHSGCVFSKMCHTGDGKGVCDMCPRWCSRRLGGRARRPRYGFTATRNEQMLTTPAATATRKAGRTAASLDEEEDGDDGLLEFEQL
ncbi:unnamed protein product [Ectocarpus sp. 8 AP-2014]